MMLTRKQLTPALLIMTATLLAMSTAPPAARAQVHTQDIQPAVMTMPAASMPSGHDRNQRTEHPYLHFVKSSSSQSIAILVNDEPITNYEIKKRQGLLGMNAKGVKKIASAKFQKLLKAPSTAAYLKKTIQKIVKANPGKTREQIIAIINKKKKQYAMTLQKRAVVSARSAILPGLRKKATTELIDEHLQLQEAKRLNVLISDDEVDTIITNIASRNKMDLKQFGKFLTSKGASLDTMRSRFKAMMSWRNVIRARFGHQVTVKAGDIDRFVEQSTSDNASKSQFKLQRIALALPTNPKPAIVAQRLQDASAIRQSFNGCAGTGALVNKFGGARLENLGDTSAATLKEPTRSMIQNAADGEMLPPIMAKNAVLLWIVCGRSSVSADTTKRTAAKKSLRQKEFEVLGQRHLKDLRQDAHIEYR